MISFRPRLFCLLLFICLSGTAVAEPNSIAEVNELIKDKYPEILHVSSTELTKWMAPNGKKDLFIIDAREQEEFDVSHLQGAVRASSTDMALVTLFGHTKDTTIVVYDSVGLRSAKLVASLNQHGFSQVYTLDGAIFEWANSGLPLYRNGKKTDKVHPNNRWWQRYLDEKVRGKAPN